MENSINRILIETFVKKTLREIEDDTERSIRNLIDRALLVSRGRFQKSFFINVQHMLNNVQSAYYTLVRRLVESVDHSRLLGFGMNVGYNSCTVGAAKIREIEAAEGFNIPWALFLKIDTKGFSAHELRYAQLLEEGKALGIFTWFLAIDGFSPELFQLLSRHPDCAFALLCSPKLVDEALMDEAAPLNNLLLCIKMEQQTDQVCEMLRDEKLLYCVYCRYADANLQEAMSDDLLMDAQAMCAPLTVFLPDAACSDEAQAQMYSHVQQLRNEQRHATIPWEFFQDCNAVDTIISDDGCSAGFRADGTFFALTHPADGTPICLWDHSLREILQVCLRK